MYKYIQYINIFGVFRLIYACVELFGSIEITQKAPHIKFACLHATRFHHPIKRSKTDKRNQPLNKLLFKINEHKRSEKSNFDSQ